MNSDYADLTQDFIDISSKFTAGKRYRLQCSAKGVYRSQLPDAGEVALILFRAPSAQQSEDRKASVILKPGGRPIEFDYTDGQAIYGAAPMGDTSLSILTL